MEKPSGEGYHANGQSDSEVWLEPVTEPAEARRPRLSFADTYVETCGAHVHAHMFNACHFTLSHHQSHFQALAAAMIVPAPFVEAVQQRDSCMFLY